MNFLSWLCGQDYMCSSSLPDIPDKLPVEAIEVALKIAKISEPKTRKKVTDAISILLEKYFDS